MIPALKDAFFRLRKPMVKGGKVRAAWRIITGKPSAFTYEPLRRLVDRHVTGPPRTEVRLMVVDLGSTRLVALPVLDHPRDPADAEGLRFGIMASASIPGVVPPIANYMDGGIREVSPLAQAFKLGRELLPFYPGRTLRIFVSNATPVAGWDADAAPEPQGGYPDYSTRNILDVLTRAQWIQSHEIIQNDLRRAREINQTLRWLDVQTFAGAGPIHTRGKVPADLIEMGPGYDPYGTMEVDPKAIREFWKHGEFVGWKAAVNLKNGAA